MLDLLFAHDFHDHHHHFSSFLDSPEGEDADAMNGTMANAPDSGCINCQRVMNVKDKKISQMMKKHLADDESDCIGEIDSEKAAKEGDTAWYIPLYNWFRNEPWRGYLGTGLLIGFVSGGLNMLAERRTNKRSSPTVLSADQSSATPTRTSQKSSATSSSATYSDQ
eukprot:GEMP01070880.1.p1 GENE.GEMP01070880.1~~GEMP01070880.1.p1  ORF type:complete len:166 (+),score=36.54 GEMP01070880.1:104-601(+)